MQNVMQALYLTRNARGLPASARRYIWKLLIDKNMKKKDLRLATGMSTTALAKLGKNQHVSTEILTKICEVLDCDFCDIIELVKEENHD